MGQKRPKMEHFSHPGRLVDIMDPFELFSNFCLSKSQTLVGAPHFPLRIFLWYTQKSILYDHLLFLRFFLELFLRLNFWRPLAVFRAFWVFHQNVRHHLLQRILLLYPDLRLVQVIIQKFLINRIARNREKKKNHFHLAIFKLEFALNTLPMV